MFDVRGWKARPLLSLPAVAGIRYGMFDLKAIGLHRGYGVKSV